MSPKRRNPNAGLFNGYWLDTNGKRIRRLVRSEYPELYRLHRIGVDLGLQRPLTLPEKLGVRPLASKGPWHA